MPHIPNTLLLTPDGGAAFFAWRGSSSVTHPQDERLADVAYVADLKRLPVHPIEQPDAGEREEQVGTPHTNNCRYFALPGYCHSRQ